MKHNRLNIIRLLPAFTSIFAFALLLHPRVAGAQDSRAVVHMTTDWSSRHLIYSGQPKGPTAGEAMQDARYLRHLAIYGEHHSDDQGDDRVDHQVDHQSDHESDHRIDHEHFGGVGGDTDEWHDRDHDRDRRRYERFPRLETPPLQRDWQFALGPNAVTGSPVGDFAYPAKYTFNVNAMPSCSDDFVVFPTGLPGATAGQASIVALNQLYSGSGAGGTGMCGTGGPSDLWAYNTNSSGDTAGAIFSSPVLSADGAKVAFVEASANGTGGAILKILKWVSTQGTVGSAAAPTTIASGNPWSTCPASGTSCLFSLALSGGASDTNSSPFYNYSSDALYVGDDNGKLHKFTGVFNGTPTEVATGGWPFTISSGNYLTGPVFDSVSGNIFVADGATSLHYVRETGSAVGTCVSGSTPCIGTPSLTVSQTGQFGVFDPPIVDSTSQRVFVFPGYDPSANAAVIQANTALGGSVDTVLQASDFEMFSGAFDKNYNSGSYSSGFLYVCGTNPTTLYRIGFNSSGLMNSTVAAGSVNLSTAGEGASCTPATEIVNGSNDFLFFGIYSSGAAAGCGSGCLLGLNLATMSWPPSLATFSTLPEANNAFSGIVVDNVGSAGQESSIYFGPQGNNCVSPSGDGCAVKVTQSGLN